MTTEGHSVAIVEDHGALRIFLRDVLSQRGRTVTGVAGTAESGGEGLIRRLAESDGDTKVVVCTATTDPQQLKGVLEAGADGAAGVPQQLCRDGSRGSYAAEVEPPPMVGVGSGSAPPPEGSSARIQPTMCPSSSIRNATDA